MNTCEATPSAAQEIRIQSLGTPEIDSPLSRNLATAGERRVVFTVDEELVDEGAAPRPMSFELAGPRDRIYFDPSKTKCAIVTCGGLCPGINDVIRAIVMTAYNAYRVPSVLGIRYGLQGFIPSYRYDVRELAPRDVEGIHEFGGTILGTSRGPQSSSEIATALERLNISALFIIGGDGTMKAAASIQQEVARRGKHISIVGIPKTIDNDINFIPHSFGFETAVDKAADAIRCAHIEAASVFNGIGIVKLMGRESGFIAANASLSMREVNFVLVPEVPFSLYGERGLFPALEKCLAAHSHPLRRLGQQGARRHHRVPAREDRRILFSQKDTLLSQIHRSELHDPFRPRQRQRQAVLRLFGPTCRARGHEREDGHGRSQHHGQVRPSAAGAGNAQAPHHERALRPVAHL